MKKFMKIFDKFSPPLAHGDHDQLATPRAKPMGITVLPEAPLMATHPLKRIEMDELRFALPAPSRGDRQVAKASSAHCIGDAVLGTGNGFVIEVESDLEVRYFLMMTVKLNAMSVCEQVKFTFDLNPKNRDHHIFDLVVDLADGSRIAA